jgi:hypothetical protein
MTRAAWRAATRIEAGVGDLMQRTGDGQAQIEYSVAGRSRGRVTLKFDLQNSHAEVQDL